MIELDPNKVTYFAQTNFRNQMQRFGIKRTDRQRHFYILGKTGTGKTTLMANMALQDIENGEGIAVVDPHGDVLNSLIDYVPSSRVNDVVIVSPADIEHPIAFNVLESVQSEYKHLVASGLMSVFKKIWANLWSARMEYILNNTILALLDSPGNTLLGIMRVFSDKVYRKKIVDKIQDPVVKSFWVNEFANYNDRFRQEAIAPIQNKVGQFLSSSIIRNIVGQPKSTIDPRAIMDDRKILLLDLSKGKIGEDNSNLLGAMMITKLWLAAMSRVDIPEEERKDFYLHVDEFQNFATDSFADILSEARKYRLNLTVAHQYIAQLTSSDSTKVRDAVFGNIGTMVCFRMGAADAKELLKEFEPYFYEENLVSIGKHEIVIKLMIDGLVSKPFTAKTLAPLSAGKKNNNREKIWAVSRERYSKPKEEVENKILRWSGIDETFESNARIETVSGGSSLYKSGTKTEDVSFTKSKSSATAVTDDRPVYDAFCDNCGDNTKINFLPDLTKGIYCKDCLKEFKKGNIDPRKLPSKNAHLKVLIENKKKPVVTKSSVVEKKSEKPAVAVAPVAEAPLNTKSIIEDNEVVVAEKAPEVSLSALSDDERTVPFNQRKRDRNGSAQSVKPGQVVSL